MSTVSITRSITSKRQVTLPPAVTDILKSKKVIFQIENNQIRLLPVEMTLEEAFGSVKTPNNILGKSHAKIRQTIQDEVVNNYK